MLHDIMCISLFKREKNIFARTTICVQIPMNNNVIWLVIGSMLRDCFCTYLMCKMAKWIENTVFAVFELHLNLYKEISMHVCVLV